MSLMVISLILLFFTCLSLSFIEDRLTARDKVMIYLILGVAMILIAGLREVGSTPDTIAYEGMYYAKGSKLALMLREPSFNLIVSVLNSFSLGVSALFITYALISVPIHLSALWRMSKFPLLILTIYISYYYMMHEMVQIRCGVASGLFLWAIYYYVENKKKYTLLFILLGTFFHYSAIAGLVIFLFNDKLPQWQRMVLYSLVPIGLAVYFTHFDISIFVPDELGGQRLQKYRELKEQGLEDEQAGWMLETHILIWMNIVLYYASIYYHDYLAKHFKYTIIAIKLQAVGLCFLFFANGLSSVLGNRMNDYFSVVSILLWTGAVYAFQPIFISKIISNVLSTFRFISSILWYALALL